MSQQSTFLSLTIFISLFCSLPALASSATGNSQEASEHKLAEIDSKETAALPNAQNPKQRVKEHQRNAYFLKAIKALDAKRVEVWLKNGMDPNAILGECTDEMKPAILHAIQQIRPHEEWPKIKYLKRQSALRLLRRGAYDIVKLLLDYGADPNIEGYCHTRCEGRTTHSTSGREWSLPMTPLCLTSAFGQSDLVKLLLDRGAQVDGIEGDCQYHNYGGPVRMEKPASPIEQCAYHSTGCASEYRPIYFKTMAQLLLAGAKTTCWDNNSEITLRLGNTGLYIPRRPETMQAEEYCRDCIFLDIYRATRNAVKARIKGQLPDALASICANYIVDMAPEVQTTLLSESLRRAIHTNDLTAAVSLPREHPNLSTAFGLSHGGENLIECALAKRDQEIDSIMFSNRYTACELYGVLLNIHRDQIEEARKKIKEKAHWDLFWNMSRCDIDTPKSRIKDKALELDKYKLLYGSKPLLQLAFGQAEQPRNKSYIPFDEERANFLYKALRAVCTNNIDQAQYLIKNNQDKLDTLQLLRGSETVLNEAFGANSAIIVDQCFKQPMLMHIINLVRTHAPMIYTHELGKAMHRNPLAILNKAVAKHPSIQGGADIDLSFAARATAFKN